MSWSHSKYKFDTHLMMAFTFPGIRSDQTPYFFWIPVSGFSFSIIYLYLPLRIKGDQVKYSLSEDMFKMYKKTIKVILYVLLLLKRCHLYGVQ